MNLPRGPDHIPSDAISLWEGWVCVSAILESQDTPQVSAAIEERECMAREIGDSIQIDIQRGFLRPDDVEKSTRDRIANLILRWALSQRHIFAYVRDPLTGKHLRLGASAEWYQFRSGYVADFVDDYLDWDEDAQQATVIRGARQRVFFIRSEFEDWFKRTFCKSAGAAILNSSLTRPIAEEKAVARRRDHRRIAVMQALRALYPNGCDGVTLGLVTEKVNAWLQQRGMVKVGERTVSRAMTPKD